MEVDKRYNESLEKKEEGEEKDVRDWYKKR